MWILCKSELLRSSNTFSLTLLFFSCSQMKRCRSYGRLRISYLPPHLPSPVAGKWQRERYRTSRIYSNCYKYWTTFSEDCWAEIFIPRSGKLEASEIYKNTHLEIRKNCDCSDIQDSRLSQLPVFYQ